MSPLETILHECGRAAGIGFWRFDAERGLLHWPRGFGPARDQSYGSWWRLGDFGQFFDAGERARLFDYFENLFAPDTPPFTLEIPVNGPDRRLQLRIEGKQLPVLERLFAGGLVRDISRRTDAEEQARSLGQIFEALMGSVQAGVLVIDAQGHIRKANGRALAMFGLVADDGITAPVLARLETEVPPSLKRTIEACRQTRLRAEGMSEGAGDLVEPLAWEATPWGRGGVVVVVRPVRRPASSSAGEDAKPGLRSAPANIEQAVIEQTAIEQARSRTLLDYVHRPCLILQSRDASIDFVNKAARERFGLKPGVRASINNLFELTGRHPPHRVYVTPDRAGVLVTLPTGARITRMTDVDPDLYFVEYA